ncbi:hypothetical protein [Urbifossiella limnaea]|nr:hypothetical protein [Urbifossiella limnaea]
MSTLGIDPPGGCHFPAAGYAEFACLVAPLVERDFYRKKSAAAIDAVRAGKWKLFLATGAVYDAEADVGESTEWRPRTPTWCSASAGTRPG